MALFGKLIFKCVDFIFGETKKTEERMRHRSIKKEKIIKDWCREISQGA